MYIVIDIYMHRVFWLFIMRKEINMKDIIQANIENIRLRQKIKDLTDALITKDSEIDLRDSHIESLEDTVAELKEYIDGMYEDADKIRLKAKLYDKIIDSISEEELCY